MHDGAEDHGRDQHLDERDESVDPDRKQHLDIEDGIPRIAGRRYGCAKPRRSLITLRPQSQTLRNALSLSVSSTGVINQMRDQSKRVIRPSAAAGRRYLRLQTATHYGIRLRGTC